MNLTETDRGRWVAYRPFGQPHTTEIGRIKDWNHVYVWVVFAGPKPYWDTGPGERTAMACYHQTLRFITMRPDGGFDELEEQDLRRADQAERELDPDSAEAHDIERNR